MTVCLATSLPPGRASHEQLVTHNRACLGAVEDGLRRLRGGALWEDSSRVREGALPRVMAAVANITIPIVWLLRTQGVQPKMIQLQLAPDEVFCRLGDRHS